MIQVPYQRFKNPYGALLKIVRIQDLRNAVG